MSCVTLWAKHVRNAGSLNLQLELEFHLCGRASTGSHREGGFPRGRVARSPSPGLRHTSEANLLAVAIELLDVVDGATPLKCPGQNIILQYNLCLALFHDPSYPVDPVHAEICFFSSVKHNAPSAIECSVRITNYKVSRPALSLSDTDAMAHLPTDHRANNLVGLDFEHMDTGGNIKFSMKLWDFSYFQSGSGHLQKFPFSRVQMSSNVSLTEATMTQLATYYHRTHTHKTWYII